MINRILGVRNSILLILFFLVIVSAFSSSLLGDLCGKFSSVTSSGAAHRECSLFLVIPLEGPSIRNSGRFIAPFCAKERYLCQFP